jgi:hypothetical protein
MPPETGLISRDDRNRFLDMLGSADELTRLHAWESVGRLIDAGIISRDDAIALKRRFLELLESSNRWARLWAWAAIPR